MITGGRAAPLSATVGTGAKACLLMGLPRDTFYDPAARRSNLEDDRVIWKGANYFEFDLTGTDRTGGF